MHDHERPNAEGSPGNGDLLRRGFLRADRLEPHEASTVERTLRVATRDRAAQPAPSAVPSSRTLIGAAAVAAIAALVIVSVLLRTGSVTTGERAGGAPARAMTLEVVRTDMAGAEPYRLVIEFEPEPATGGGATP